MLVEYRNGSIGQVGHNPLDIEGWMVGRSIARDIYSAVLVIMCDDYYSECG